MPDWFLYHDAWLVSALTGLALALCAAALYIHVLRRRSRHDVRGLQDLREQEARRMSYCVAVGHDLDKACLCMRCLTPQHDYRVVDTRTVVIGSELVNPRADPGATYLDSNFQPDHDYGLTQTIYETERTHRCARCSFEMRTTERHAVVDDR